MANNKTSSHANQHKISPRRGTVKPIPGKSLLKGDAMRRVHILAAAGQHANDDPTKELAEIIKETEKATAAGPSVIVQSVDGGHR